MKTLATIAALATLTLAAASAGAATVGFGPRVGYTHDSDLDQAHFGGQAWIADLFTNTIVILPSLELGVGDGATVLSINGDAVYEFTEFAQQSWGFYAGAGLALNRYDIGDYDNTDFGLNLLAGTTYRLVGNRTAFAEIRLGLEDSPDLKLTVGLNFF